MGDSCEKEGTTRYAKQKINLFLGSHEYHLALLIAYIYADIRLRTLITDWIKPQPNEKDSDKWKKTAEIFKGLSFMGLQKTTKKLGLISKVDYKMMDKLREMRNNAAHDSTMWRNGATPEQEEEIKNLCSGVIKFLEKTN